MPDARNLCTKAVGLAESGQYNGAPDLMNKAIKKGINIALYIENHQPSNREVLSYGGGARQEW